MKNFISPGLVLTLSAITGGVTAGVAVMVGGICVVPATDADEATSFAAHTMGVFTLDKKAGETWAQGDVLYLDNSTGAFTKTSDTGLFKAGVAAEAVTTAGDTEGAIRLDGVSTVAEA